MAATTLSFRFSFEQARRQARDLHRALIAGDSSALHRLATHHPDPPSAAAAKRADAQLVVAREHGFGSWARLKHFSEPQPVHQSEELADGQNAFVHGRPWEEREARLHRLARQALERCALTPLEMSRVGHMDNFGYSDFALGVVTERDAEPSHLVKVRYSYDHFPLVEVHRQVASLCAWLAALDRDTQLQIQAPVADADGDLCQLVDHRPEGPAAICTVQRWVPGRVLVDEDAESVDLPAETLRELGRLLGGLHLHGRAWHRPAGFNRVRIDWLSQADEVGKDHWNSRKGSNLDREQLALVRRAIEAIVSHRRALEEPWGLTHGDFTPGNCVADGSAFKVIDFDHCALTYQLDDVGWCLLELDTHDMRRAFLDGYVEATPALGDFARLVEGALIAARTRRCAWGGPRPEHLIPECESYLANEPFLFAGD